MYRSQNLQDAVPALLAGKFEPGEDHLAVVSLSPSIPSLFLLVTADTMSEVFPARISLYLASHFSRVLEK